MDVADGIGTNVFVGMTVGVAEGSGVGVGVGCNSEKPAQPESKIAAHENVAKHLLITRPLCFRDFCGRNSCLTVCVSGGADGKIA